MAQIPENINNAVREYISELSKEIPVQKAVLLGHELTSGSILQLRRSE
jgi:hypothetical protein